MSVFFIRTYMYTVCACGTNLQFIVAYSFNCLFFHTKSNMFKIVSCLWQQFVDANQNHLCENFVTYNPKYILRKASKIVISLAAFTIHII